MQTADPDAAIEALAAVFRTMPRYPLVDTPSATALYQGYEDWARHFLTGTSAPLGSAAGADPAQRHWASAQVFFRERRQVEQSQVQGRDRELTGLAQDLLLALRDTSVACGEVSGVVEEGLQRVQALLAGNSLEQLRSEFAHMAARMRNGLAGQRAIFEQQLGEMRQRVEAAEQARAQSQAQANALGSSLAELRQALEETRQQMQLDPLTRIYNRGAFDDALRRYVDIAQAGGQTLALLLLDIDHFKAVNDRYGHPAGDAVLTAFADLLSRSFLRADDFVARYGGEEFAVLLFVPDASDVVRLVEGLFERLRRLRLPQLSDACVLTCSGGYVLRPAGSPIDAAELVERADRALYEAKRSGRDCLVPTS